LIESKPLNSNQQVKTNLLLFRKKEEIYAYSVGFQSYSSGEASASACVWRTTLFDALAVNKAYKVKKIGDEIFLQLGAVSKTVLEPI
jgi:hypothetical protein